MSWYEIVAECKVRALVVLDDPPSDERLAEVLGEMIYVGVEEHFGIVRETAISLKSAVPVEDTDPNGWG
jgi:hypothetical protein